MKKKLAIIGAGGHGKVVGEIALLNQYDVINFFDNRVDEIKNFPFTIVGNIDYLKDNFINYDAYFVAVGDNKTRSDLLKWLEKQKLNIISLIHPKSIISKFSTLGIGTCVMAQAVINAGSKVKDGVIINTSASVDHDCIIDDFVHISPNCSLSGNISIGKFSPLGTGTSVHPGNNIGKNVRTAIGSKIFKDILENTIHKN